MKPYKVNFDGKDTNLEVLTKPGKNSLGLDVPGQVINLDYTSVSDIMKNKFGIDNVYDLQYSGKEPKHVTVKRVDISGKKDQTEVDNKAKVSPKKDDEKQVQGGIAVYNGTKWVMKK